MIRGVTVTLLEFSRTGVGLSWDPVEVGNVLIAPVSEVDSTTAALPEGHRAVYHLAIPKADTHRWEGQLVQFWGSTWAVVGIRADNVFRQHSGAAQQHGQCKQYSKQFLHGYRTSFLFRRVSRDVIYENR